uniref:Diguanylate cyclase n=1 Tax=uncultured bacterium Contigcl_30 TaxID=1393670 RepID=W0FQ81_9BACT|nr:diguanylate cyclase [uncultured bacterium Contigcl_30]
MPGYFRKALMISETTCAGYFMLFFLMLGIGTGRWEWPAIFMAVGMIFCRFTMQKTGRTFNFVLYNLLIVGWVYWYVLLIGFGCGGQLFLVLLMMFGFFNIYEKPIVKLISFALLIGIRMLLHAHTLRNDPLFQPDEQFVFLIQMVTSLTFYFTLALCFILFSSSIQNTERELRLHNQELHKEAGTDPLTQLKNRRAMLDEISMYIKKNPDQPFSVAIADIDYFKKVNDTYGHQCGDYTLKELSGLFRSRAVQDQYSVCRWGGEEFCFFMPGKNIDDAGRLMTDLNFAVEKMPLDYEDIHFSITITIGVEENDFRSPLDEIMEQADRKLYMGKANGRNQVVV